jgi:hypothetical protein
MDETIERLLPCEGEQFGVFSPTGPNTALIGSVLAETCRVIGTVDSVLMPKTPPIMDLCRLVHVASAGSHHCKGIPSSRLIEEIEAFSNIRNR